MEKSEKNKKLIRFSVVIVLICFALLVASTFAWFTDKVVNEGNVIHAGTLKIVATAYDWEPTSTSGSAQGAWETNGQDLKIDKAPVINHVNWEPGQSNTKRLLIENAGSLTADIGIEFDILKNVVTTTPQVSTPDLTPALWVEIEVNKLGANGSDPIYRSERKPMSEIESILPNVYRIEKNEDLEIILTYGMNKSAGNEYMFGRFDLVFSILAKQSMLEKDGFGSDKYDEDAPFPPTVRNDLGQSLSSGVIANSCYVNDENPGTFNGNGNTITLLDKASLTLHSNQTIKDLIIDGESNVGNMIKIYNSTDVVIENVDFVNFTHNVAYVFGPKSASEVTFKNCTFSMPENYVPIANGNYFVQISHNSEVAFENCTFNGNSGGAQVYSVKKGYGSTATFDDDCKFTNCEKEF